VVDSKLKGGFGGLRGPTLETKRGFSKWWRGGSEKRSGALRVGFWQEWGKKKKNDKTPYLERRGGGLSGE